MNKDYDTTKDNYALVDGNPADDMSPPAEQVLAIVDRSIKTIMELKLARVPAAVGICVQHAHRDLLDAKRMLESFVRLKEVKPR